MVIYLVEDDSVYASFVKKSLEQNGIYSVNAFANAEQCFEIVQKSGLPDALIFDYNLPGMTGIDLYEKIRPGLKQDQKCIIMSSMEDGNLVLSLIQRGVRDYVIKDENVIGSLVDILEGKEDEFLSF
jgi:two-component system phosphate regulon response regulator PhoB